MNSLRNRLFSIFNLPAGLRRAAAVFPLVMAARVARFCMLIGFKPAKKHTRERKSGKKRKRRKHRRRERRRESPNPTDE
jgi:hypothetical protein